VIGSIIEMPLAKLRLSPRNLSRSVQEPDDSPKLKALSQSIREIGLLNPLQVTLRKDGEGVIYAGARRYRAAVMAKLKSVPVRIISEGSVDDVSVGENVKRLELTPIDLAGIIRDLRARPTYKASGAPMTVKEIAQHLDLSPASVNEHSRLIPLLESRRDRDRELVRKIHEGSLNVHSAFQVAKLVEDYPDSGLAERLLEKAEQEEARRPTTGKSGGKGKGEGKGKDEGKGDGGRKPGRGENVGGESESGSRKAVGKRAVAKAAAELMAEDQTGQTEAMLKKSAPQLVSQARSVEREQEQTAIEEKWEELGMLRDHEVGTVALVAREIRKYLRGKVGIDALAHWLGTRLLLTDAGKKEADEDRDMRAQV
jgi:ParB/RepB/Spo0J family partition protein